MSSAVLPACDCGHEFSADPREWHLDFCAFRRAALNVGGTSGEPGSTRLSKADVCRLLGLPDDVELLDVRIERDPASVLIRWVVRRP